MAAWLDPDQLRTLVAFADSGSCRAAAAWVHRTPSAVSLQLSKLAQTVSRQLTRREGRRLVLTDDGHELVRHARRILNAHSEALARFTASGLSGPLRVGLPDDYIPSLLPLMLATLAREAPRARVEVLCAPSAELRPLLAAGELDLAILSAQAEPQVGVVLRREAVVWAVSSQHGLQGASDIPLALFPPGCIFRNWALAALTQAGREHHIAMTSRSMPAVQSAVASGFAISVLPRSCLVPGVDELPAQAGFPPLPMVNIVLATSPGADGALAGQLAQAMRSRFMQQDS